MSGGAGDVGDFEAAPTLVQGALLLWPVAFAADRGEGPAPASQGAVAAHGRHRQLRLRTTQTDTAVRRRLSPAANGTQRPCTVQWL